MMEEENRKILEYARQQQQNEEARMEQKRLKEEAMDSVYKKVTLKAPAQSSSQFGEWKEGIGYCDGGGVALTPILLHCSCQRRLQSSKKRWKRWRGSHCCGLVTML